MSGTSPAGSKAEIFIDTLINYVRAGERELPEGEMNGSSVFILGNTGAGKSTLINYLAGCEMQRISGVVENYVSVKETSSLKEVVKIGHSKSSETLIPKRVRIGEDIYYDCPGFLDTRGTEFKIANMLNIARAFQASSNARVIVLINYSTILADKADRLRKMAKIVTQFIGSSENINLKKNSLLVGITKVPLDSKQKSTTLLKETLKGIKEEQKIMQTFAERLFIYDPLDETDLLSYQPANNRETLLQKINQLDKITEPENLFRFDLAPSENNRVNELSTEISEKSLLALQNSDPNEAVRLLSLAKKLQRIPLLIFANLLTNCKNKIAEFWNLKKQAILLSCAASNPDLNKINGAFQNLKDDLELFDPEERAYFGDAIDLLSIKNTFQRAHQKCEAGNVLTHLSRKKQELLQAAKVQGFYKMYRIFVEVVRRVSDFSKKYKEQTSLVEKAKSFMDECTLIFSNEAKMFLEKIDKLYQFEKAKNALDHKLKLSEEAGKQAQESFLRERERQKEEIRKLEKEIADLK